MFFFVHLQPEIPLIACVVNCIVSFMIKGKVNLKDPLLKEGYIKQQKALPLAKCISCVKKSQSTHVQTLTYREIYLKE